MRINKKPGPSKLPKSVEFQKFIPTVAIGQVHHKVLRAKEEVKNKRDPSGDTYSNGR
jgi:hypothetical protein